MTEYAPHGLTMMGAIEAAKSLGFGADMRAGRDGHIIVADAEEIDAAEVEAVHEWRIEGASDAADQMIVVAIDAGGERGAVVLTYGPNATAEDAGVLDRLDMTQCTPGPAPEAIDD